MYLDLVLLKPVVSTNPLNVYIYITCYERENIHSICQKTSCHKRKPTHLHPRLRVNFLAGPKNIVASLHIVNIQLNSKQNWPVAMKQDEKLRKRTYKLKIKLVHLVGFLPCCLTEEEWIIAGELHPSLTSHAPIVVGSSKISQP